MNIELLRIICMLLIISSHCILNTDLVQKTTKFSANWYLLETIRILTRFSVNVFVIITGYFMVKSKFKIKKVFKIWGTTLFYSLISLLIAIIFFEEKIKITVIIKNCLPFSSGAYWFITVYLALYIFSPYINKLIKQLNKKQFLIALLLYFFMVSIAKTFFPGNLFIEPNNGCNLLFFIYLYMIGAYIRLYYNKEINKNWYLIIVSLMTIITLFLRVLSLKFLNKDLNILLQLNSFFNMISTVAIFLYFRKIKIKSELVNKTIFLISPTVLGIYLMHDHLLTWKHYVKFLIGDCSYANTLISIPRFIGVVLLVFIVCFIIEKIRSKITKIIVKTKIFKKIENIKQIKKISNILLNINEIMEQ